MGKHLINGNNEWTTPNLQYPEEHAGQSRAEDEVPGHPEQSDEDDGVLEDVPRHATCRPEDGAREWPLGIVVFRVPVLLGLHQDEPEGVEEEEGGGGDQVHVARV